MIGKGIRSDSEVSRNFRGAEDGLLDESNPNSLGYLRNIFINVKGDSKSIWC